MDITVRGRNVEVPDHYKQHVADKLTSVTRYPKIIRIDVELHHERNPRQANFCQRVEITCKSKGPTVRSEASAADFYTALDLAVTKIETRLRRAADRRRVHYGAHRRSSISAVSAAVNGSNSGNQPSDVALLERDAVEIPLQSRRSESIEDDFEQRSLPGQIVREKDHQAKPMTTEQALFEMELVGHDFYLFQDVETGAPSVVYRRKGYDYGVVRLMP